MKKRTVKISEKQLIATIEKLIEEGVALKKTEWLSEQKKNDENTLEETISKIVAKQLSKK